MNAINFIPSSVLNGPVSGRLFTKTFDTADFAETDSEFITSLHEKLSDYIALSCSDYESSELVQELSKISDPYMRGTYMLWLFRIHDAAYKGKNDATIDCLALIDEDIYVKFIDFAFTHVSESMRFVKQLEYGYLDNPTVIVSWEHSSLNPVMLNKRVFSYALDSLDLLD